MQQKTNLTHKTSQSNFDNVNRKQQLKPYDCTQSARDQPIKNHIYERWNCDNETDLMVLFQGLTSSFFFPFLNKRLYSENKHTKKKPNPEWMSKVKNKTQESTRKNIYIFYQTFQNYFDELHNKYEGKGKWYTL